MRNFSTISLFIDITSLSQRSIASTSENSKLSHEFHFIFFHFKVYIDFPKSLISVLRSPVSIISIEF